MTKRQERKLPKPKPDVKAVIEVPSLTESFLEVMRLGIMPMEERMKPENRLRGYDNVRMVRR